MSESNFLEKYYIKCDMILSENFNNKRNIKYLSLMNKNRNLIIFDKIPVN